MAILDYLIETKKNENSIGKPITSEHNINNFWNWFGSSKVKDKHGRPIPVYHGSIHNFSEFKSDNVKKQTRAPKYSYFFTDHPMVASGYTARSDMFGNVEFKTGGNVIPVYLYMINPLLINAKGENWDDIPFMDDYYSTNDIVSYAQKEGYDGVIIKNVVDSGNKDVYHGKSNVYVTFDEKHIKSAIANTKFNPLISDIKENII